MNILLTGGTGYIGSHSAAVLAAAGHRVVLFDNLSNSTQRTVDHLEAIGGWRMPFVHGDVRHTVQLAQTLQTHGIEAVIHFAGLKAVGESVARPVDYFASNVQGSVSLLQAMQLANVKTLVFSSSATVYGSPRYLPVDEAHPTSAANPYGRTKLQIEEMLADTAQSGPGWRIACLRYFNPVGAHESALIGENPSGTPNNLMPYIARVAAGQLPHLNIFGDDYPTPDGTGVRDYIHVMDLAEGHLAALDYLATQPAACTTINLGTGRGYSVLEMLRGFESATGQTVPYRMAPRRAGDIASCYALADKAATLLGWRARRDLKAMCQSTWSHQIQHRQTRTTMEMASI
jgi:UDP-glucose 4-epimerase